jgi:hypothetical protein
MRSRPVRRNPKRAADYVCNGRSKGKQESFNRFLRQKRWGLAFFEEG